MTTNEKQAGKSEWQLKEPILKVPATKASLANRKIRQNKKKPNKWLLRILIWNMRILCHKAFLYFDLHVNTASTSSWDASSTSSSFSVSSSSLTTLWAVSKKFTILVVFEELSWVYNFRSIGDIMISVSPSTKELNL